MRCLGTTISWIGEKINNSLIENMILLYHNTTAPETERLTLRESLSVIRYQDAKWQRSNQTLTSTQKSGRKLNLTSIININK